MTDYRNYLSDITKWASLRDDLTLHLAAVKRRRDNSLNDLEQTINESLRLHQNHRDRVEQNYARARNVLMTVSEVRALLEPVKKEDLANLNINSLNISELENAQRVVIEQLEHAVAQYSDVALRHQASFRQAPIVRAQRRRAGLVELTAALILTVFVAVLLAAIVLLLVQIL